MNLKGSDETVIICGRPDCEYSERKKEKLSE